MAMFQPKITACETELKKYVTDLLRLQLCIAEEKKTLEIQKDHLLACEKNREINGQKLQKLLAHPEKNPEIESGIKKAEQNLERVEPQISKTTYEVEAITDLLKENAKKESKIIHRILELLCRMPLKKRLVYAHALFPFKKDVAVPIKPLVEDTTVLKDSPGARNLN